MRVESFCGLVFGTFSDATPAVETFLGEHGGADDPAQSRAGRQRLLGMHSQIIHNNWKLYAENVRNSYHATLLHTFYTTFKVNRLDMDGGMLLSDDGRHSISYAQARDTLQQSEEYQKVHSAQYNSGAGTGRSCSMPSPSSTTASRTASRRCSRRSSVQLTLNSLAVRFFTPRGIDKTELFWIYLGYAGRRRGADRACG